MKKILLSALMACILSTFSLQAKELNQPINPFEEIQKLQQQMDQIFNQLHQKFLNDTTFANFNNTFTHTPATDIQDRGNVYIIKADIPGADEKSIQVSEKDGILKIEAQTIKEEKKESDKFIQQERFVGKFVKMLTLPKNADTSKLKTTYKNGIVEITVPKK